MSLAHLTIANLTEVGAGLHLPLFCVKIGIVVKNRRNNINNAKRLSLDFKKAIIKKSTKQFKRARRNTITWISKKKNQRRSAYAGLALALLISGAVALHLGQTSHARALELAKKQHTLQITAQQKKAVETKAEKLEEAKTGLEQKIQTDYVPKAQYDQEVQSLTEKVKQAEQSAAIRHAQAAQATYAVAVKPATPTYSAPVSSGGDIQSIIVKWANYFGVSPSWLLGVARCESTFNTRAYNASGATGLFQFMPSTFYAYAPRAGAGSDIYSAEDQSRTAAYMFSIGQAGQWVCK